MTIWTTPEGRRSRDHAAGVRTRIIVALAALGLVVIVACEDKQAPASASGAPPVSAAVASHTPAALHHAVARPAPAIPAKRTHAVAPSTCGAPANPWGYNFCGHGSYVVTPARDVCAYFSCIGNFDNGKGYMVECNDGDYSMSGGRSGACSYHQGVEQPVYSGR